MDFTTTDEVPSLDALPDDALTRVLAGAGSRGIAAAAAACSRLARLARSLAAHTCFASASALGADLEETVALAVSRALSGMLGAVDFALVFVANHSAKAPEACRLVRKQLPEGTPVLGCLCAGLMGVGPEGPFELDPEDYHGAADGGAGRPSQGVSVLLGRMPGCSVRLLADVPAPHHAQPPPATCSPTARALHAAHQWLHGQPPPLEQPPARARAQAELQGESQGQGTAEVGAEGAVAQAPAATPLRALQAAWLISLNSRAAMGLMYDGVLEWIKGGAGAAPAAAQQGGAAAAAGRRGPVLAGGVASGRGGLIFHPGRLLPPGTEWDEILPSSKAPKVIGLAILATEVVQQQQQQGVGGTAPSSGAGAPPAPVRTCAMSMRGCGPVERAALSWQGVEVVQGAEPEEIEGGLQARGGQRHGGAGAEAPAGPEGGGGGAYEDDDGSRGLNKHFTVTVSGGVCSQEGSGAGLLGEYMDRVEALDLETQVSLALWAARRGDSSLPEGLSQQVLQSGLVVIGAIEGRRLNTQLQAEALDVAIDGQDWAVMQAMLAGNSGMVLCAQFVAITAEGCRALLRAELPAMCRLCSAFPALPSGRPDPRSWEGYAAVRAAAQAVGARAGPVALAVFSCTGRGRAVFGGSAPYTEASVADEVMMREVPFVGTFCSGELGPCIRGGYVGWAFSSGAADPGALQGGGGAGASGSGSGGAGAACNAAAGRLPGRRVNDAATFQGYTSVYAALG